MSLLSLSPTLSTLKASLETFITHDCIPAEKLYEEHIAQYSGSDRWQPHAVPPIMDALKSKAQSLGFWNLFLPHELPECVLRANEELNNNNNNRVVPISPRMYLTNREYGILCEVMGRSSLAPEACNCSAPDTGNMEVLLKHGTQSQQLKYLLPLLRGEVRSAFLMTEPDVASSDARNLETRLSKRMDDGGSVRYTLNGKKWWSTGAMDPRCRMALVVTKMDYTHPSNDNNAQQQTQTKTKHGNQTVVIVPMPQTGVRCVRPLTVFGYDDAPHGHAEVWLESVELGMESVVLGEGRGFEISQSRLGPGRIHHCMRAVGLAARCYELMLERTFQRKTFGKFLYEHGSCREIVADSAADIESARLLTLSCAEEIDRLGARGARDKIALIKVVVPELTSRVVDRAVQVFGGAGVCGDFPLARALVGLRTLRIADGPDAVHKQSLALLELKKAKQRMLSRV
mmetsp:Transcript_13054/g.28598  ORF Transcript_13054/g.28598 Transcript_13054/m.28598 type:complete len:457 (-) Transcript_13054:13-1383(-)